MASDLPDPVLRRREKERLVLPRRWLIVIGILAVIGIVGVLLLFIFLILRACVPLSPASPTVEPTPAVVSPTLQATYTPTPLRGTPTPTVTFTPPPPTPTPTLPAEITVGGYVRVLAAAGVNLREGPGVGQAAIRLLENGEVLKVVDGPQEADGYTWWKLEDKREGRTGWAAESTADTTLLEPALPPE